MFEDPGKAFDNNLNLSFLSLCTVNSNLRQVSAKEELTVWTVFDRLSQSAEFCEINKHRGFEPDVLKKSMKYTVHFPKYHIFILQNKNLRIKLIPLTK